MLLISQFQASHWSKWRNSLKQVSAIRNPALAGQFLHRVCSLELVSCWQCQPPQLAPAAAVSVPGTVGVGAVYQSWSHQSLRGCSKKWKLNFWTGAAPSPCGTSMWHNSSWCSGSVSAWVSLEWKMFFAYHTAISFLFSAFFREFWQ